MHAFVHQPPDGTQAVGEEAASETIDHVRSRACASTRLKIGHFAGRTRVVSLPNLWQRHTF